MNNPKLTWIFTNQPSTISYHTLSCIINICTQNSKCKCHHIMFDYVLWSKQYSRNHGKTPSTFPDSWPINTCWLPPSVHRWVVGPWLSVGGPLLYSKLHLAPTERSSTTTEHTAVCMHWWMDMCASVHICMYVHMYAYMYADMYVYV